MQWKNIPAVSRRDLERRGITQDIFTALPKSQQDNLTRASSKVLRANQRKIAKQLREGTYQPSRLGAKAREAATRYEQEIKQYEPADRVAISEMMTMGWWKNRVTDGRVRARGSAQTVLNRGIELSGFGVPDHMIGVFPVTGRKGQFVLYSGQVSP